MDDRSNQTSLWITGLPGSGRSTVARKVYEKLTEKKEDVILIEQQDLIHELDLNIFEDPSNPEDLDPFLYSLKLLEETPSLVIVSSYLPNADFKDYVENNLNDFHITSIECSFEEVQDNLKVSEPEIKEWIENKSNSSAEAYFPDNADLTFTKGTHEIEEMEGRIIKQLASLGALKNIKSEEEKEKEEEELTSRLKNLGYI